MRQSSEEEEGAGERPRDSHSLSALCPPHTPRAGRQGQAGPLEEMVTFHGNKKTEAHFPDTLLDRNLVSMGQGVMMPVINVQGQFSKLLIGTLSFRPHGNPKGAIIKPFYRWESGGGSSGHLCLVHSCSSCLILPVPAPR